MKILAAILGVGALAPCLLVVNAQDPENPCTPCAGGGTPGTFAAVCEVASDLAPPLVAGAPECLALQLLTYQSGCCSLPPDDYCTLCENDSQNYNTNKLLPRNAGDSPNEFTCANVATRNQYIREVEEIQYGICGETQRERSRAWCECDEVQPNCELTCDDGNPPPDLTKTDPIFGETCLRFVYEYTTLRVDECLDPVTALFFDAKAFCCNEPEPDNCSVCPEGKMIESADKEVLSEFFGTVTCGEIDTYDSYRPADSCKAFIDELLDNPFGAEGECCIDDPSKNSAANQALIPSLIVGVASIASVILTSGSVA